MRGAFTLHLTEVRENRAYLESRHVDVPWNNKDLDIKWEHFTSKLEPNQKETWTAVIAKSENRHPKSEIEPAVAEMVATLYDKSLDAFMPFHWQQRFAVFRQDYSTAGASFENTAKQLQWLRGQWDQNYVMVDLRYREFPPDLVANYGGYALVRSRAGPPGVGGFAQDGRLRMERYGLVPESAPAESSRGAPIARTALGAAAPMESQAKN